MFSVIRNRALFFNFKYVFVFVLLTSFGRQKVIKTTIDKLIDVAINTLDVFQSINAII